MGLNKLKNKKVNIKYETIKTSYITKEQAVAIAGCDRNLKDSVFKEWKKNKLYLGWISFSEYDVALVQIGSNFAWHIKVKSGDWGGTKFIRIPIIGIKYGYANYDGGFDENSNISCLVMCDSGEYYYCNDIDMSKIKAPDMKEYKKYINRKSIYHCSDSYN